VSSLRGIAATAASLQCLHAHHNFLPAVDPELERCGLLRELCIDGNNVMKVKGADRLLCVCLMLLCLPCFFSSLTSLEVMS
jgi:hypothetical protein